MPAPPEAQVRGYLKTLSNWGRWGSEDELGTINPPVNPIAVF